MVAHGKFAVELASGKSNAGKDDAGAGGHTPVRARETRGSPFHGRCTDARQHGARLSTPGVIGAAYLPREERRSFGWYQFVVPLSGVI